MTPTREQFKAVAEWLGFGLNEVAYQHTVTAWVYPLPRQQDADGDDVGLRPWQPHLPGIDSMRLMAALGCDVFQYDDTVTVVQQSPEGFTQQHDGTPDSKLQALASAVWQCAVRVAQEAKKQ